MGQEIQQAAFALDDFSLFQKRLAHETHMLEDMATMRQSGGADGLHALLIGVLPTWCDQMLTKDIMSASSRYHALNKQLFAMRGNSLSPVCFSDSLTFSCNIL